MKFFSIVLCALLGMGLQMRAQATGVSAEMNVEKIFMSLPDSCFSLFGKCVNDSSYFMVKNRFRIIDPKDSSTADVLNIEKEDNETREFSMTSFKCRYATTMRFTWWNSSPGKILVAVVVEQVDMCTENQVRFFYEFSDQKIIQVKSLPAIPISDFVPLKTLKTNKIDPATPAPVFIRWKNGSDTLVVTIEIAPYLNCADSYSNSPLTRLKEKQLAKHEILFCRENDHFVKCNGKHN